MGISFVYTPMYLSSEKSTLSPEANVTDFVSYHVLTKREKEVAQTSSYHRNSFVF